MENTENSEIENDKIKETVSETPNTDKSENLDGDDSSFEIPFIDPSVYKFKKRKKTYKIILIAVISVLVLAYFAGVIYHAGHFGTDTYINGLDVSGMSVADAEAVLIEEISGYSMSVNFKNGQETIKVGDGDLKVELANSVKSLKDKRNPFAWITDIPTKDEYTMAYNVSYDSDKLREFISKSSYMEEKNMEPSVNAKVEMKDGEVTVIPDVTGTELDRDKVYETVFAGLDSYSSSVDIEENDCYIRADITEESQSIIDGAAAAEDYLSISANFDFAGTLYRIPREELSRMAYVDSKGKVVISKSNVEAYARRFSEKFSTSYTDRKFETHDGDIIMVYGGYYGWVLDPEKEGTELYSMLLRKSSFAKKPACEREGYAFSELNDIGDSYVEIDLKDQHVYLFVDGKKIYDTPCVTGNMPGYKTPGGLFGVTYMALNVTLKGADYESPVTYWMPFNGDIGMHDANWRYEFGDDIYTYDGSHGCVNLPYEAAATIFEYIEPGFPVVCYWDDEVERIK